MNTAFADTDLTFSGGEVDALETFLTRFNAIFTLKSFLQNCADETDFLFLARDKASHRRANAA